MNINFTERDKHLIIALSGEIDHHATLGIRQNIDRAFARSKAVNMIFDFSRVDFMDSSGIGILIGRYRELSKQGGKVYAIGLGGEMGRIFEVSGLARIIPSFGSLEEVLASEGGDVI